ncbi:NAD-dependent succinate-semialdehyde dehydrogenase [Coxiella burnetii]|uniref:Succinate-semialdehyde dehydrogenase (NADP+) n=4 Tax=Coxiella burnetii TaxID=777 RepID=Q83CC3_COXBU|nr:NAD-dependent succinate-semialdehyde dehydrogenase [Coxiella burnetii]NP_820199.2 succinate-semialdehyde dehydrogenase (NADP+) [Coxiella burnetii RSA 493]AAO90713.2 succinate-semialdehyde dehydrogenase (NADP+) [Coxiella burnetii RSA 493]ARI66001.1 succinate-semialdehyde dehydrogenase [Coxiella burnetii]ARK27464.1 succinate-semialdehyde dehydrogenase [Coxiella burnetii]MCF2094194.1 NAD-dependent succinate-semialdehyde dehydrogenase [Coxiella burnetii]MCF2096213.1 NAD-dependent succinate-sem
MPFMPIRTTNPSTGEVIKTYQEMTDQQVEDIINDVHYDYEKWRSVGFKERGGKLRRIAERLRKNKTDYAKLIATEMGKPITAGEAEAEKCAWVCDYYADHAEALLKPRIVNTDWKKSYVTYQPSGVIFGIMPWNFPLWQVFRFAAPNLMAGHGCLLKHASISTGTALAIEKLIQSADLPDNIFRTLVINTEKASDVISHPKISAVTLTGSEGAGKAVGSAAGKALKKVVLELGGNDAYLILKDADLEKAAEACVESRLSNSGQSCIAAKRLIIVENVYDEFKALVIEKAQSYRMGDPLKKETELGPLARSDLRDTVHGQVRESIDKGALLETGGEIPESKGFYYPPTVLSGVRAGQPAFDDEVFGPVIALIRAKDEKHAIEIANNSKFGLGAAVFTNDNERGEKIAASELQAGTCVVNTFVKSDPRLPFGGVKHSGYGRELAAEGIRSFMNVKTVVVD